MNAKKIVFVGQGPNRTAWQTGLETARKFREGRERDAVAPTSTSPSDELWAERYCARVAITGSVGRKLAELGGWRSNINFNGYARRNLNARWNGKSGKGDSFDGIEARIRAKLLLGEPFDSYVLLGAEVARAFGFKNPLVRWLEIETIRVTPTSPPKSFLIFPHPSGINLWWNESFNRFRARKRLREFLQPTNP